MPFEGKRLSLNIRQRADLEEIARSRSLPVGFVLRAKIVRMLGDGASYAAVKVKLDTSATTISRWKKRHGFAYKRNGTLSLCAEHQDGRGAW